MIAAYTDIQTTFDKDEVLHNTDPHYTDERFGHAQVIFGRDAKGLEYVYSDRLYEWDYHKAERAVQVANASEAKPRTCRWYEIYLSAYFEKPIKIGCIIWQVSICQMATRTEFMDTPSSQRARIFALVNLRALSHRDITIFAKENNKHEHYRSPEGRQ